MSLAVVKTFFKPSRQSQFSVVMLCISAVSVSHAQQADWTGAAVLPCLEKSLRLHTSNASTEHLLGIVALRSGDLPRARKKLCASLSLDPDFKVS